MTAKILETALSAVRNVTQTRTHALTLQDAVNAITGQKHAPVIAEIRRLQESEGKKTADELKKKLPAISFAGTFSKRNNKSLIQHSGLMCLDFDDCGVGLKETLAADPHAVLCFVSPRGTGLKLVIRIEPAADAEEHGASFDVAKVYFRDKYGIEADPSGRDVCRLCFVSHDPGAVFQDAGEMLQRPYRQHSPYMTIQDNTSKGEGGNVAAGVPTHTVEQIIEMTQPTQPGQRHRQLFNLARGLSFECALANTPLPDLKKIVQHWFDMAKPKIGTQAFSESWSDFVHAWPRVNSPLATNSLAAAWDAVQAGELPPIAEEYDAPKIKQLIGLCYHLGRDRDSFYLSTHKAGVLFNVKPMQVLRWLRMLQADMVLALVKTGNETRASTYKWLL